jgi:predicted nucleic acid-binding protein
VKAVVDTNVIAYLLLGNERFLGEARSAMTAISTALAPAHWEAELATVVWMSVRTGVLPLEEASVRLTLARRLGVESIATATLCQGALLRAVASGVSVSDTLFVELAMRERCPLATFDKAVLKAFPDVAVRPGRVGDW